MGVSFSRGDMSVTTAQVNVAFFGLFDFYSPVLSLQMPYATSEASVQAMAEQMRFLAAKQESVPQMRERKSCAISPIHRGRGR